MAIINVTLDPATIGIAGNILSNGNLTFYNGTGIANGGARATHGKTNGKWYWEVKLDSGINSLYIGIGTAISSLTSTINSTTRYYYGNGGNKYPENISYGQSLALGGIIGVALDMDNGTLEFYQNGVSMGVSHTDIKNLIGEIFPLLRTAGSADRRCTINFGATPFSYPIPNGYFAYNIDHINKFLIKSGDGKISSINGNKLVSLSSQTEKDFIDHGMDKSSVIDLSATIEERVFVNSTATTLGAGNVFKQAIDTSKIPIKGVSIT